MTMQFTVHDNTNVVDKYFTQAQVLLLEPDNSQALVSQFSHLSDEGDLANHREYLYLAARAYRLAPTDIRAMFNYGSALSRTGRFAKSAAIYTKCVEEGPPEWRGRSWHHLGITCRAMSQNAMALQCYDKAIAIEPLPGYRKDRALTLMGMGRLQQGFEAFEVRRELAELRWKRNGGDLVAQQKLPMDVVHWQGEDITGKTVVVFHEEGSGDFIHMCRFIPHLRDRGAARILLTGPVPELLELVGDNISIDGIVPLDGPFVSDYVVGSMSVPWRVGIDYATVSGAAYFKAKPAAFPRRGPVNVGLVWRGSAAYGQDMHRSMDFRDLCPLFEVPNVAFYSLQVGPAANEVTQLGFDGFVADLGQFIRSWRKTAGIIAGLDAVVTVDTAVGHLAGALGVPVFIMVTAASDWRWDRTSERTAWYDSARVIRQERQGDWGPVVERVKCKLEAMASGRRQNANADQSRPACPAAARG